MRNVIAVKKACLCSEALFMKKGNSARLSRVSRALFFQEAEIVKVMRSLLLRRKK